MNTVDGTDRRDPASVDVQVGSTMTVDDDDGVLLFDVDRLDAWIRSTVVTDVPGNR